MMTPQTNPDTAAPPEKATLKDGCLTHAWSSVEEIEELRDVARDYVPRQGQAAKIQDEHGLGFAERLEESKRQMREKVLEVVKTTAEGGRPQ